MYAPVGTVPLVRSATFPGLPWVQANNIISPVSLKLGAKFALHAVPAFNLSGSPFPLLLFYNVRLFNRNLLASAS